MTSEYITAHYFKNKNSFAKRIVEPPKEKLRDFFKGQQLLGRARYYYDADHEIKGKEGQKIFRKAKGGEYYLDTRKVVLIFILGARGSGKTWLGRRLASTIYPSKRYHLGIVADAKDEMKYSKYPTDLQHEHLLADKEVPYSMPVKVYRPFKVFEPYDKPFPSDNIKAALPFKSINQNDIKTMLNIHNQFNYEILAQQIAEKIADGTLENFYDVIDFLKPQRFKDLPPKSINQFRFKIKHIAEKKIFVDNEDSDLVVDLKKDFEEGCVPVLNLRRFEKLGQKNGDGHLLVGLWLRKFIDLKEDRKIQGRMFLFILEAGRWASAKNNPVSKFPIEEAIDLTRGYDISLLFESQEWTNIASNIKTQSDYIFVPYNLKTGQIIEIFDENDINPTVNNMEWKPYYKKAIVNAIKSKMQEHEWMVINTNKSTFTITSIFAPLNLHKTRVD